MSFSKRDFASIFLRISSKFAIKIFLFEYKELNALDKINFSICFLFNTDWESLLLKSEIDLYNRINKRYNDGQKTKKDYTPANAIEDVLRSLRKNK